MKTDYLSSIQAVSNPDAPPVLYKNPLEGQPAQQGKAQHQIFNKDTLATNKPKEVAPSFWTGTLPNWLKTQASTPSKVSDLAIQKAEPIKPMPELDKPDLPIQATLENDVPQVDLPQAAKHHISNEEIEFVLSNMSPDTKQSIERIIAHVMKAQLELEKDNALLTLDAHTRLRMLKKIQDMALEEIKKALAKDERIAGHLKTAQTIAMVAAGICGIASVAVTAGFSLPFLALAAKVGTFISGIVAAGTYAGQGYNKAATNRDKAKLAEYKHEQQKIKDLNEYYGDQMTTVAENDSYCKEAVFKAIKSQAKTASQIFHE